ncbi:putative GAF-like domain superfamily protein [Plasmopara halstedii]
MCLSQVEKTLSGRFTLTNLLMPVDKRQVAALAENSNDLGVNWKSAQCVTSLYDSYIQVQQENEKLREDVRQLQQNEFVTTSRKLQQPEHTKYEEFEQEIRLLRSEKLRMEEIHRLEQQKLEARVTDSEAQHQQLVVKYQERFEFDPLETKRAALAVKTLQNTLQNVILEKEELEVRYGDLRDQYRKLHNEQMIIVERTKQHVKVQEQQQVRSRRERVINVLTVWSTKKVLMAWCKWRTLIKNKNDQEERKSMMDALDVKTSDRIAKIRNHQAGFWAKKILQQAAKRTFYRWKNWARRHVERRRIGESLMRNLFRLDLKLVMASWRSHYFKGKKYRAGVYMIERLVTSNSRRWGMQMWSVQSFRLALTDNVNRLKAANDKLKLQDKKIVELKSLLDEASTARQEMQIIQDQEKKQWKEKTEKERIVALAVQERLGNFLVKQSDRQTLKNIVREWKIIAICRSSINQRAHSVQMKMQRMRLHKSVSTWLYNVCVSRKKHLQTQYIHQRMRQVCVLKCFNSWKAFNNEQKVKKAAFLSVISRMRDREAAQCFLQWMTFTKRQLVLRVGLDTIIFCVKRHQTLLAFSLWKEMIVKLRVYDQTQQQQRDQDARLELAKRDFIYLQQIFTTWRQSVLSRQKRDIVVGRCLARLKHSMLANIFLRWEEYFKCKKMRRGLIHRWIKQSYSGALRRAWSRWQWHIALKEKQLLINNLLGDKDAQLYQLETIFERDRGIQQTLLLKAQQIQATQEQKLQETVSCLSDKRRRAQRLKAVLKALCTKRAQSLVQLRAHKAWHNAVRRSMHYRNIIETFQSRLANRQICLIFSRWSHVFIQRHCLKNAITLIQSYYSRRWQIQCFEAWNETRRQSKIIQRFTILYLHKADLFAIQKTFQGWRTFTKERILLRKLVVKVFVAKVQQQFVRWKHFTSFKRTNEQLEQRKVTLNAFQVNLLRKRSRSMMLFCLAEWKLAVEMIKKQHDGEQKLMLCRHVRLVALCFKNWIIVVAIQRRTQARNTQLVRWLRKDRHRMQQRAMTLWKLLLIRDQGRQLREVNEIRAKQQKEMELYLQKGALPPYKLASVSDVHNVSITIARCFNALKLGASIMRYQNRTVHFLQYHAHRQHLAKVFLKWCNVVQNSHEVKSFVSRKIQQQNDTLVRISLRQWYSIAYQKRVIKNKLVKFRQRVHARILENAAKQWYRFFNTKKCMSRAADHLNTVICRLNLKHTLSSWRKQCREEINQENEERYKHKKLMQFLAMRQEVQLLHLFRIWIAFTQNKHTARDLANQRHLKQYRSVVTKCWNGWCSFMNTLEVERKSIVCIEVKIMRFYYRIVLTRWRRYQFLGQIETLQTGNELLSRQLAETNLHLRSKSLSVDQLSSDVRELQHKLLDVESYLFSQRVRFKSQEEKHSLQLRFLLVLNKLMLNRTISKDITEAFLHWKRLLVDVQSKNRALSSVTCICQRNKKILAFWVWKFKILQWRRYESFQKYWRTNELMMSFQRWQRFWKIKAKQQLFLVRRCLMSYTIRSSPISIAFRLWRVKSTALSHMAILCTNLQIEQDLSCTYLRRLTLGKLCWMAYHHRLWRMRAFFSHCRIESAASRTEEHRRVVKEMKRKSKAAVAEMSEQNEATFQAEMGLLSPADEQATSGASIQVLQTLIRRLFQSTTVQELFDNVASTFAQILHGASAILFLFDPSSNELWTQREGTQLIQVPASLGIAGSTQSSGSSVIIMDVSADPRYHPMVDQFVLSGLPPDNVWKLTTFKPRVESSKPLYGMVSSALVSIDGAVYGVLQVAFSLSNLSLVDRRLMITQTQLCSKICCFYVEQVVYEIIRNCRDRVQARVPDKFIRLFRQTKNWRKYFAVVERKALEVEGKLREVLKEHEQLLQSRSKLQQSYDLLKNQLEEKEYTTKEVSKLLTEWKRKVMKWQQLSDKKDQEINNKTSQLKKVEKAFEEYRQERRNQDIQMIVTSSVSEESDNNIVGKSQNLSDHGQLSILHADKTRLKSQLVRAEADNLLLVKALSIARNQHGELPKTIQTEVNRVATRVVNRVTDA